MKLLVTPPSVSVIPISVGSLKPLSEDGEEKKGMHLKAISELKLIRSSVLVIKGDRQRLLGWLLKKDREYGTRRKENLQEL